MKKRDRINGTTSCNQPAICCFRNRAKTLWAFCMLLFLVCTFVVLLPIRFTPLRRSFSQGPWRKVNTFNFVKIMSHPFPSGVKRLGRCANISEVNIPPSLLNNLSIVDWNTTEIQRTIKKTWPGKYNYYKAFMPLLKPSTKRILLRLYLVLHTVLKDANVPHVLVDGALLGMYRFSGLSPWDDDFDIYIPLRYWRKVRALLSCLKGYGLMVDPNMRWSFFPSSAPLSRTMAPKRYPFIDLFFYAEEGAYVWPLNSFAIKTGLFLKDHFYPFTWGIFEGLKVPIPYKLKEIVVSEFGDLSVCITQSYGHMHHLHGSRKVNCSQLFPLYGKFPLA